MIQLISFLPSQWPLQLDLVRTSGLGSSWITGNATNCSCLGGAPATMCGLGASGKLISGKWMAGNLPSMKLTQPLNIGHLKRKFIFPTSNFQVLCWIVQGSLNATFLGGSNKQQMSGTRKFEGLLFSRWWFQTCFMFTPKIGWDSHFDKQIFNWVETTK